MNRAAYLPNLAMSLWMAAVARQTLSIDLLTALDYCDRAIELFRELTGSEPDAFGSNLIAVETLRHRLSEGNDGPA